MTAETPLPPRGLLFKACSPAGFLSTGEELGYLRADGTGVGEAPAVWVMNRDGSEPRQLTDAAGRGADFPRWVPAHR